MKDFISTIKEYQTSSILRGFASLSIEIFNKKDTKNELNCCINLPIKYYMHGTYEKKGSILLSAWDIQAIQYLSIINGNDYRKKEIKSTQELAQMINLYREYENINSGADSLKNAELKEINKFLFGLTYEQFIYQSLAWIFQNFNRNYHILIGSKRIARNFEIGIDQILNEKLGLTTEELIQVYLIIFWLCGISPDPLNAPEDLYKKNVNTILTKANIRKVIEYYTATYEDVRESNIGKQIFYGKPFIKTKRCEEYLETNYYLVSMLMADGLYWIIRDYYCEKKSQEFVNAFGTMFEDYVEELAEIYLQKNQWIKLPQERKKGADFSFEFNEVVLILELKSSLLSITAKQQNPNRPEIDKYLIRNIEEAYKQLQNTEEVSSKNKPILKIILLYENLMNTQMIHISIPEIFEKDERCYVITIADLEMLLVLYSKDQEKFHLVIDRLLEPSRDNDVSGKSMLGILNELGVTDNLHFLNELDYFHKLLDLLKNELVESTEETQETAP